MRSGRAGAQRYSQSGCVAPLSLCRTASIPSLSASCHHHHHHCRRHRRRHHHHHHHHHSSLAAVAPRRSTRHMSKVHARCTQVARKLHGPDHVSPRAPMPARGQVRTADAGWERERARARERTRERERDRERQREREKRERERGGETCDEKKGDIKVRREWRQGGRSRAVVAVLRASLGACLRACLLTCVHAWCGGSGSRRRRSGSWGWGCGV